MYKRQLLCCGNPVNTEDSGWHLDKGWDWCRWPGTTVIRLPYEQLKYVDALENHRHFSDETATGGVTCQGENGLFAMSLHDTQYTPVSYTHLDVYKRQIIHFLQPQFPFFCKIPLFCSRLFRWKSQYLCGLSPVFLLEMPFFS